jgi:hypothetical protein
MILKKFIFPKRGDLMLKKSRKADAEPNVSNSPVTMVDRTIIGDQIYIEGTIRGEEDLLIEGSVKGSIEIKAKSISVEDGAYLKAVIELEREPTQKTVPLGKPEAKASSEPTKEPFVQTGKDSKGN